jgi:tRNA A37 threonylcarbamoyladenosine modification protein TsaB
MSYAFLLKIEKDISRLVLLKDTIEVAAREWPEERGSGKAILTAIDDILTEMNMTPQMVDNFIIDSSLPETYTSYRVAKTIAVTYGFATKKETIKDRETEL